MSARLATAELSLRRARDFCSFLRWTGRRQGNPCSAVTNRFAEAA
jgi:hypothetical protein